MNKAGDGSNFAIALLYSSSLNPYRVSAVGHPVQQTPMGTYHYGIGALPLSSRQIYAAGRKHRCGNENESSTCGFSMHLDLKHTGHP